MELRISIKNVDLRNYVRYLFPKVENGCCVVSRNSEIGLFMCALVNYKDTPDKRETSDIIRFRLPVAPSTSSGLRKHCFFTAESEAKIIDYINASLKSDFDRYWLQGRISGLKKKDIVDGFLLKRGLFDFNADSKSKKGYRIELQSLETKTKQFYDKAHLIDKKIREEQENYKKSFII